MVRGRFRTHLSRLRRRKTLETPRETRLRTTNGKTNRKTTLELVKALGNPPGKRKNPPATRAFQAVRIATNDEPGVIERVIPQAIEVLNPGGRLAIITFHFQVGRRHSEKTVPKIRVPESREPTVGRSAMMFLPPEEFDDASSSNLSSSLPPAKIVKMINRNQSALEEEIANA